MTVENQAAAPITGAERNMALDVTRGFAVLGILAANIWIFAFPVGMVTYPGILEAGFGDGPIIWIGLVDSAMRGLFSLLFGAGMVIFLERAMARDGGIKAADLYFKRTVWLLVFGLINAYGFMWLGDILFMYASLAFILYAMRNLSSKWMILLVVLMIAFRLFHSMGEYHEAVERQGEIEQLKQQKSEGVELSKEDATKLKRADRPDWNGAKEKFFQPRIDKVQSGLAGTFEETSTWAKRLETTYFYKEFALDILIMFLLGVVLLRAGFLTAEASMVSILMMTAAGLAVGGYIRYELMMDAYTNDMGGTDRRFWGALNDFSRIGLALGYLGILQAMVKSGFFGFIVKPLAAVGRMALTNYLSQSIICAFIFYGFGFGLYGELRGYEPFYIVFAIWAFQLITSPIWLKFYRFGPFEWVWRSLTYGERMPMKRAAKGEVS